VFAFIPYIEVLKGLTINSKGDPPPKFSHSVATTVLWFDADSNLTLKTVMLTSLFEIVSRCRYSTSLQSYTWMHRAAVHARKGWCKLYSILKPIT